MYFCEKNLPLKLEYLIVKRFLNKSNKSFSYSINKVAILSISLGVAVMILAIAIVTGFQNEITNKVIGFGGHIIIGDFSNNHSYEYEPVAKNTRLENNVKKIDGVKNIQAYANKAGIIKTETQIQGFILKGISRNYDLSFLKKNLIKGNIPLIEPNKTSNQVLISKYISDKLNLNINQKLKCYFIIDEQIKGRAFQISGIYETGLEEFDKKIVFCDISHVQKINNWDSSFIEGYEVSIKNINDLEKINQSVYKILDYNLNSSSVKDLHPEIFDWLSLTDMNVIVIIIIITLITSVTMISVLLILILDKTNTIGILKSMGMQNKNIRNIFIYNALFVVIRGIIIGNIIAFLIGIIQIHFGIFKLNQESYFLNKVPVNFNILHILIVNAGIVFLCFITLLLPSLIISKITPVKSIKYK